MSRVRRAALGLASVALLLGCATPWPPAQSAEPSHTVVHADPSTHPPPEPHALRRDVEEVLAGLESNHAGEVYAGATPGSDPDALAFAVALVDGRSFAVGDDTARFPLMSISKPFTYALAVEQRGAAFMRERVGVAATGFPYNAVAAGAVRESSAQNPLVNAGAIATHSYLRGATPAEKTAAVVDLYGKLAGRALAIEESWRVTPRALTYTLAYQMKSAGRLEGDVDDVTRRYLEACIVAVQVADLAQMGATLATGGVQPRTGRRVLERETVRSVLSAMVVAGMYEESGSWWTRVGLPAKSGVSGAILAVVPGWGALVAYSPRLDAAGNSVRAALAIERLAERWRLHSFDRLIGEAGGRALPEIETETPAAESGPPISTFSIVARDSETGDLGVAVQSRYFAVGAVVPHAAAGVGALATQARGNLLYGPQGLGLLEQGVPAAEVVETLTAEDPLRDQRQLGVVDRRGRAASFTGKGCLPWAGSRTGTGYTVQGNLLTGPQVVDSMATAFEAAGGDLASRLVYALAAGQAAGGDARGRQSAAVLVVRKEGGYLGLTDRYIDLHVEDHPTPIRELRRLLAIRHAQLAVARAEDLLRDVENAEAPSRAALVARARGELHTALELHPSDDHAWWLLAQVELLAGDPDGAAEAGRRALLENPSWRRLPPDTLRSLGVSPELLAALMEVESFRRLWASLASEAEAKP